MLVDFDGAYGCDPNATTCASTYDGLHPNALGEYRIARAFGTALHDRFGIGAEAPKEPGAVMPYDIAAPETPTFDGTGQGVTVTWPKVFGAHDYDPQWRDVTSDADAAWEQVIPSPPVNRYGLSWQFNDQPHEGHTCEVRVRPRRPERP
ncbi:hypothetical protein ACQEVS_27830 [Streptomyces sp. CA-181903]|uniref:hypothetical protein n=1 Tax=Streptomyces sp. CA-181903 TaxID=3240055 RepID=UPI003D912A92